MKLDWLFGGDELSFVGKAELALSVEMTLFSSAKLISLLVGRVVPLSAKLISLFVNGVVFLLRQWYFIVVPG